MRYPRSLVYISTTCFAVAAVLGVPAKAQGAHRGLVTTQWVAANLSSDDVRIVDVCSGVADYWQAHIPGAVYLSPDAIRWPDQGVPLKLIRPEALVRLLGELGIDKKTTVLIYTETGDYKAAYLLWALDYIGHRSVFILDGGFTKWRREGRPVTQDYPEITPTVYPRPSRLNQDVRATLDEVKAALDDTNTVILDVRPVALYTGEQGASKRKGHIAGAINHFWGRDLTPNGVWRSKQDLTEVYNSLGATPERRIIVSCGQGQMSAHAYFTLKYILGYKNVANYDGGFNEWSNIDELGVNKGMEP